MHNEVKEVELGAADFSKRRSTFWGELTEIHGIPNILLTSKRHKSKCSGLAKH